MKYARQIKKWLVLLWLLVPVGLLSYHFGPGKQALAWQEAAAIRERAKAAEAVGHWDQAVAEYGQALGAVPSSDTALVEIDASDAALARDQLRLAQIRSAFQLGNLVETLTDLEQFVKHVETTHGLDSPVVFDTRDLLGRVHYQAMVALRLESAEKQVWMKHWELSRQNFRFLAEHSPAKRNLLDRKNLEVVIKSANLPTPPVPAGGGGGGGGAAFALAKRPTPPTTGTGVAPPDNRRLPTDNTSALTPPEFELGN